MSLDALDRMDTMECPSALSLSEYDQPPSEVGVELDEYLDTAISRLSVTAKGELFSDVDANDCISAGSVSEYSLAPSETNVEMPNCKIIDVGKVRVLDSLYCLEKLDDAFLVPVSFGANFLDVPNEDYLLAEDTAAESVSEYSMAPSETEVTMAGM